MNINQEKQMESGRTMLEMMAVMAIMGVIMYGAIASVGFGVTMYKVNATYNQVEDVAAAIRDLYSWSSSYPVAQTIENVLCGTNQREGDAEELCDTSGLIAEWGQMSLINAGNAQCPGTCGNNECDPPCIMVTAVPEEACLRLLGDTQEYSNVSVETQNCNAPQNMLFKIN